MCPRPPKCLASRGGCEALGGDKPAGTSLHCGAPGTGGGPLLRSRGARLLHIALPIRAESSCARPVLRRRWIRRTGRVQRRESQLRVTKCHKRQRGGWHNRRFAVGPPLGGPGASRLCRYMLMAKRSVFQTEDEGSSPSTCTRAMLPMAPPSLRGSGPRGGGNKAATKRPPFSARQRSKEGGGPPSGLPTRYE